MDETKNEKAKGDNDVTIHSFRWKQIECKKQKTGCESFLYSSGVCCDRSDDEHEVEADDKFKNKRL